MAPNGTYSCSNCNWPMCNKNCQESQQHKTECEILALSPIHPLNQPTKQSIYATIAPLRALLLKRNNPTHFQQLMECQSHLTEHIQTKLYQILKTNLVPLFLRNFTLLETNEEEILNICSILDTNCFQIRYEDGAVDVRGLYPVVSLLAHDCQHNTRHYFKKDSQNLVLEAATPIKKGEIISTTYTQTLLGTLARKEHLKMAKLFDCTCKRCKDPTELGLYVGSILCPSCQDANEDEKLIAEEPGEENSIWRCRKCGYELSGDEMVATNNFFKDLLSRLDRDRPEQFEEVLSGYSHVLHGTNSFALEIKYALTQIYGKVGNYELSVLPSQLIDRKIDLLRELVEVGAVLEPGQSRFKGLLLYALQETVAWKTKILLERNQIGKDEAEIIFNETLEMLKESGKILQMNTADLDEIAKCQLPKIL